MLKKVTNNLKKQFKESIIYQVCKYPTSERYRGFVEYKTHDVSRFSSMSYRKRWFMIFQRNLPWEFEITYYEPHKFHCVVGTGPGIFNFAEIPMLKLYKNITYRMKTEDDVHKHMVCINKKFSVLTKIRQTDIAASKKCLEDY